MAIKRYKYQTDAGTVINLRMDQGKKAVTGNTEPTGAIDDPKLFAVVSDKGRRRKSSLAPRGVTCYRTLTGTIGSTEVTKTFYVFIPCLTPTAQQTILSAANVNYGGYEWLPASAVPEA